jgi:crotonobetainyl-CoA:carnitine CoA-transferase CaiB-like acyl-CoA transferase
MEILAALHERDETGEGQFIEIAQFETAVDLLDTELVDFINGGEAQPRMGNRSPRMCPHGVFRSSDASGDDSWVAISVRDDAEWRTFCATIGRPDLSARGEFGTLDGRKAAEDAIEAAIAAWTSQRSAWEATTLLNAAGIPASPVERIEDLVAHDPSMATYFVPLDHPETGTILTQNEPVLWDGERLPSVRAPLFGEHTFEVLQELAGIHDPAFADLAARGVLS